MDAQQFLTVSGMQQAEAPVITDPNTGDFVAVRFELLKPGNYFYDLTKYVSALQGEQGYQLPADFEMNHVPLSGDATITIEGNNPKVTNNTIYAIPQVQTTGSGFRNIIFPPDIFNVSGTFNFTFVIQQGGSTFKSSPFLLRVSPDMVSVSGCNGGNITPYDSVFDAWRAKLNSQFQTIQDEADHLQTLFNQYQAYADGVITQKLTDVPKLDSNNTYTGTNSFNNVDLKSLSLNGTDITNNLIKETNYISGTLMNGITWYYANLYQMQFANRNVAILAAVLNIPNNSTFKNASESNPVPAIQFPSGTISNVGGTYINMGGAEFQFKGDTLNFCGLINTTWGSGDYAIRDTAIVI